MEVLFYIREDYLNNIAGDTIQFLKTKEYLNQLGVGITVSHDPHENLFAYDIIHLFNTIRVNDTYRFFKNACHYKKKIILTPIYWNYIDYIPKKNELELVYWNEGNRLRNEIFQKVDMILPSSEIEMRQIEKNFLVNKPYQIIPNGVDIAFESGKVDGFCSSHNIKDDFVLCVGRICQHKNQLSLAQITKELNIPLVLVGPVNNMKYYNQCINANPKLKYISCVSHLELVNIYKVAKVHALVSWYEIPGLANLEAGLAGCNLVTTREGSTKEYFKDLADYVDSTNLNEIRNSIISAMKKGKSLNLHKHIKSKYLWQHIAEKIKDSYKDLLEKE